MVSVVVDQTHQTQQTLDRKAEIRSPLEILVVAVVVDLTHQAYPCQIEGERLNPDFVVSDKH